MVTVIFRAKMKEGKENEALEWLKKMVGAVEADEAGALAYIGHRSQDDPSEIVFFEIYADDAAFEAHRTTPHMAEMGAGFVDLFDASTLKVERLDRVAGFARAG